mmetsp:Transcript_31769/g.52519  ORF Transcript_31769/g.52519 Transcript_31769/m.52519 type:complete len:99 (-) Transcript_31769:126-422(-)
MSCALAAARCAAASSVQMKQKRVTIEILDGTPRQMQALAETKKASVRTNFFAPEVDSSLPQFWGGALELNLAFCLHLSAACLLPEFEPCWISVANVSG